MSILAKNAASAVDSFMGPSGAVRWVADTRPLAVESARHGEAPLAAANNLFWPLAGGRAR